MAASDIYGQLVPATRGEQPLVDLLASGLTAVDIVSGGETFACIGPSHTGKIDVQIANRAFTYVFSCLPIPAAGTLHVDFRALGKWYRLEDDGTGTLSGEGSGHIDYSTGTASFTFNALPDVGSAVLLAWASGIHFVDRAGTAEISRVTFADTLATPAEPGSVTFTWLSGGVTKTATADTAGTVTGDADGYIAHLSGKWLIAPKADCLPDGNAQISIDYNELQSQTDTFTGLSPTDGYIDFTLSDIPKEGTCCIEWWVSQKISSSQKTGSPGVLGGTPGGSGEYNVPGGQSNGESYQLLFAWDNAGSDEIIMLSGYGTSQQIGTINRTTGAVHMLTVQPYNANQYQENMVDNGWSWVDIQKNTEFVGGWAQVTYALPSASPVAKQETVNVPPLVFKLMPGLQDMIVPGTVRFKLGNVVYSDRSGQGLLYWSDGTVVGEMDYMAGTATVFNWTGATLTVTVVSCISTFGEFTSYDYQFRTAGSPLQPAGTIVQATAEDGTYL